MNRIMWKIKVVPLLLKQQQTKKKIRNTHTTVLRVYTLINSNIYVFRWRINSLLLLIYFFNDLTVIFMKPEMWFCDKHRVYFTYKYVVFAVHCWNSTHSGYKWNNIILSRCLFPMQYATQSFYFKSIYSFSVLNEYFGMWFI